MKDIHATATRLVKEERWDAHELLTDALLQVETALDTASQFVASATHGSLHPEQVCQIDRADLRKITAEEAARGYKPLLRSCFELTTAPTTIVAVRVNGEVPCRDPPTRPSWRSCPKGREPSKSRRTFSAIDTGELITTSDRRSDAEPPG